MNGIEIEKKRLTPKQAGKIILHAKQFDTMIEGYIDFANYADISLSSLQKALRKKDNVYCQVSSQIIDKIINAL